MALLVVLELLKVLLVLLAIGLLAAGVSSLLFRGDRRQRALSDETDWVLEKQLDPGSPRRDPQDQGPRFRA